MLVRERVGVGRGFKSGLRGVKILEVELFLNGYGSVGRLKYC